MKLTPKQLRFVEEYLADFNATQAAIRAGYSPQTARVQASQNLTKLNIRSKIEEAFQFRAKQALYDNYWVIENLKEIIKRAMARGNYAAAIKALYLLGKNIGMFSTNKFSDDLPEMFPPVVVNINQMTDGK